MSCGSAISNSTRAARQHLAGEHEDALVAEIANEGDVVLDHADRDAARRDIAHDTLDQRIGLPFDAGHRLVEQQALGVVHQGARHADQLLLAEGDVADRRLRDIG